MFSDHGYLISVYLLVPTLVIMAFLVELNDRLVLNKLASALAKVVVLAIVVYYALYALNSLQRHVDVGELSAGTR